MIWKPRIHRFIAIFQTANVHSWRIVFNHIPDGSTSILNAKMIVFYPSFLDDIYIYIAN